MGWITCEHISLDLRNVNAPKCREKGNSSGLPKGQHRAYGDLHDRALCYIHSKQASLML